MAKENLLKLPDAKGSKTPLKDAFAERRSGRDFTGKEISLQELAELLFAAQGITHSEAGFKMRTVPSAGALYPVNLYVIVNRVSGLEPGVYLYVPEKHALELCKKGNFAGQLADACLGQEPASSAAVDFAYCYAPERIEFKYGKRSEQYALLEAGASMQNAALMCAALGLGNVIVGAFDDGKVSKALGAKEKPLALQAIGKI